MALLFTAPVAAFLRPRAATGVGVFALLVALLPDVDTYVPFLAHHGATHTVASAVLAGLVGAPLAAGAFAAVRAATGWTSLRRVSLRYVSLLGGLAVFLGVLSHVFADLLVVLPGTEPVPLFWPVSGQKYEIRVVHLGAPVRNAALFVGGLAAHALAGRRVERANRDRRGSARP